MGKIKEYKWIIILILVVLAGAFYWYEWRPYKINKDCVKEVTNEFIFNSSMSVPLEDQDGWKARMYKDLKENPTAPFTHNEYKDEFNTCIQIKR